MPPEKVKKQYGVPNEIATHHDKYAAELNSCPTSNSAHFIFIHLFLFYVMSVLSAGM